MYEHRSGKENPLDERRFSDIARTVATVLVEHRSARILEVGCATGRLLSLLREAGFPNVRGLDPSAGCARAAWELYGVQVSVGSVFSISDAAESFDCVILIGVLEHIEDLRGALEHVRRALVSGGVVYAEVPDAANLAGRADSAYQEFSTEHINFFSTISLANAFRANGFDTVTTARAVRQQHDNTMYPAAYGIFRPSTVGTREVLRDEITEPRLLKYIHDSSTIEAALLARIAALPRERSMLVWGTGTHTRRLLAIGALNDFPIAAFVDSNPKYHGRRLHGIPVIGPGALLTGARNRSLFLVAGISPEILTRFGAVSDWTMTLCFFTNRSGLLMRESIGTCTAR